jgi:hypothetical protein
MNLTPIKELAAKWADEDAETDRIRKELVTGRSVVVSALPWVTRQQELTAAIAQVESQGVSDAEWEQIAIRRGHELRDLMDTCAGKELRIVAAEKACKRMHETLEAAGISKIQGLTVGEAFDTGWILATKWAKRDDLICDMDSPAYKRDKTATLEAARRAT